jgi:hypothetical protein
MPYPGIIVRSAAPSRTEQPTRADVALFVGMVGRRAGRLPDAVLDELTAAGWAGDGPFARGRAQAEALLDVPVAVESFAAFDALFAWDAREIAAGDPRRLPCPLGLAVKSFFLAGGRRAVVVRVGDPLPLAQAGTVEDKRRLLRWTAAFPPPDAGARVALLPGLDNAGPIPDPNDARTWHGAALAWGVEEAALLVLPDLPEIFAAPPADLPPAPEPPAVDESFKPCAPALPGFVPASRPAPPGLSAPRLDRDGIAQWATALRYALQLLDSPRGRGRRRDMMLLASLPLPSHASADGLAAAEAWPLAWLTARGLPAPGARLLDADWLGSARLQLAYPWLATEAAAGMPEGVEGPEGALAGAIARTTLAGGVFRSAAGTALDLVRRGAPEIGQADLRRGLPDGQGDWLGARISLFGMRGERMTLLSDVTAAAERAWRAGGVSRLMGQVLRASRVLGQARVFEPAGPALWQEIRAEIEEYLEALRLAGALAGESAAEAYEVRCDETTMRPADIEAGRVIVRIAFTAAQPVERITVTLDLRDDGGLEAREAA